MTAILCGCVPALGNRALTSPKTRAERSAYQETSHYADVAAFLDSLHDRPFSFGSIGKTGEGRDIPYVIASYPRVATPEEARSLARPVVYVQANIHAGEVEGKEALLALVRDLSVAPRPNVLDSVILIAVPIYNADGNERFASQSVNRSEQNGPELVGVRANAQGFDLNRDYIKAEAPETRASLAMFNKWDPDVFVDLHTTDGSYHGYALTYAPPLNPASPLGPYTRDTLLPILRARMKSRHNFETFDYGDFISDDTLSKGWETFDPRPRYGTNYYGLRGRISILSEAFSHDSFERRIASTYAFVHEILSLVAERRGEIRAAVRRVDERQLATGDVRSAPQQIPIRSVFTAAPDSQLVVAEVLERTGDTLRSAVGVRKGFRRTGRYQSVRMPVYDRFNPTVSVQPPAWYLLSAADSDVVKKLFLHGVFYGSCCTNDTSYVIAMQLQNFVVDSVVHASRLFQGHLETRVTGTWQQMGGTVPRGAFMVSTDQIRGLLATYLLEPESDDGLITWNFFDKELAPRRSFPVQRANPVRANFVR